MSEKLYDPRQKWAEVSPALRSTVVGILRISAESRVGTDLGDAMRTAVDLLDAEVPELVTPIEKMLSSTLASRIATSDEYLEDITAEGLVQIVDTMIGLLPKSKQRGVHRGWMMTTLDEKIEVAEKVLFAACGTPVTYAT